MSSFVSPSKQRIPITKEADLDDITPGSLLEVQRGSYTHWAVYIGDRKVVHLTVEVIKEGTSFTASFAALSNGKGCVLLQLFKHMIAGEDVNVYVNNASDSKWKSLTPEEIVRRARSQVGKTITYDIINYNCEHFANDCRYGMSASLQVEDAANAVNATVGAVATVAWSLAKLAFNVK